MTAELPRQADFAVIGAGIVGISIGLELRRRHPDSSVLVLEKEPESGLHASGRNSGVLHAGFYYGADSLKARFTREGNRRLTEYCLERGLPINRCGKVVVARGPAELDALAELVRRGERNGVPLRRIGLAELAEIEPRARSWEWALYSPTTATVDPLAVLRGLVADAVAAGVRICVGCAVHGRDGAELHTGAGRVRAGYVINAAGLYADRIARLYGFSRRHRILPFKGLYLYAEPEAPTLRAHVYPVPDLVNPFLGVHLTVTVDGRSKLGPTAIPAFWREQYAGLQNFRLGELVDVLAREASLFLHNRFGFRRLAIRELRKHSRAVLVREAGELASGVRLADYRHWGRPGIRAQLLDLRSGALEMDFVVEGDAHSLHVLNAVSPAFTCAPVFAEYVVDLAERWLSGAPAAALG